MDNLFRLSLSSHRLFQTLCFSHHWDLGLELVLKVEGSVPFFYNNLYPRTYEMVKGIALLSDVVAKMTAALENPSV